MILIQRLTFALLGLSLTLPGTAPSPALAQLDALEPVDMTWLLPPPEPTEDSSRFVVNDTQIVGSLIGGAPELVAHVPRPSATSPDRYDDVLCRSYDTSECQGRELFVRTHLPPCTETSSPQCVESVAIAVDGLVRRARFVRYLDFTGPLPSVDQGTDGVIRAHAVADFPGDDAQQLPPGGRVGLWEIPELIEGSSRYLVVDVGVSLQVSTTGSVRIFQFGAGVTPVQAVPRPSATTAAFIEIEEPDGRIGIGGTGFEGWSEECAYRDVHDCFMRTQFPDGAHIQLTSKVSSRISGWLHGRIVDPEIDIEHVSSEINRMVVSGYPAQIPVIQRSIPNRVLPERWAMPREPWFTGSGVWHPGTVLSATDPHQLDWFEGILPWLGERADAVLPTWSFRAVEDYGGSLNRCMRASGELLGLVSTTAMMYDGGPPDFVDGVIQYRVSGVHENPAGGAARGSYSLVMKSEVARCLYGFAEAPLTAEISVVSENGEEQVATTSMSESDGWLKLTAENFTFSSPTIEMKLMGQEQTTTLVCLKSKKKIKGPKKVVVKGSVTKPPRCPKGYRPV